jgi:pheromone shutdown-related protein TraB
MDAGQNVSGYPYKMTMTDDQNIHRLNYHDKKITLIGTAHISLESVELVGEVISRERPEIVCIELCQSRYDALTRKKSWKDTDLIKVIKERKAFLLLSNLMLAYFQKRIGKKLGIKPGEEILRAINRAETVGARIHLADRDVRTTLARTWRLMGFWTKLKLMGQFLASSWEVDNLKQEDIERMKREDVLETILSEIGGAFPHIRRIIIDERDQYLAHQIRTAPGKEIVAVVGAGHVPGIQRYWHDDIDMLSLEAIPPRGRFFRWLKWVIPALIIGLIITGFFFAGKTAGTHMIKWWILANAVLAGVGAAVAMAHPLTVLSAVLASPLTSLNPMIAAGWVSGLVETFMGKPKVRDFENLPEDIASLKGFWQNKITRILLVVVFTNMGSALGTFVAIPLMVKAFA